VGNQSRMRPYIFSRTGKSWRFPSAFSLFMNLVAADVRRLILFRAQEVRASSRPAGGRFQS